MCLLAESDREFAYRTVFLTFCTPTTMEAPATSGSGKGPGADGPAPLAAKMEDHLGALPRPGGDGYPALLFLQDTFGQG